MSETLSLSIFTIEADRKPLIAFAAKKHQEAEAFCSDKRVLTKLRLVRSGGIPLCDDDSILRIRLATSACVLVERGGPTMFASIEPRPQNCLAATHLKHGNAPK